MALLPNYLQMEHATAVFVLVICIFVGGLISYNSLPREAAPDIPIPIVIVTASDDASPSAPTASRAT